MIQYSILQDPNGIGVHTSVATIKVISAFQGIIIVSKCLLLATISNTESSFSKTTKFGV